MTAEELQTEALKLDNAQRAALVARLLESLDSTTDEELSQAEWSEAWLAESQRRDVEMDADPSIGVPADEVLRRVRNGLR